MPDGTTSRAQDMLTVRARTLRRWLGSVPIHRMCRAAPAEKPVDNSVDKIAVSMSCDTVSTLIAADQEAARLQKRQATAAHVSRETQADYPAPLLREKTGRRNHGIAPLRLISLLVREREKRISALPAVLPIHRARRHCASEHAPIRWRARTVCPECARGEKTVDKPVDFQRGLLWISCG